MLYYICVCVCVSLFIIKKRKKEKATRRDVDKRLKSRKEASARRCIEFTNPPKSLSSLLLSAAAAAVFVSICIYNDLL